MIVLDTDVLSFLMRPAPPAPLVRRFADIPVGEQATTAINIAELRFGALKTAHPDRFLDGIRLVTDNLLVLPFDLTAAEAYAHLRAGLFRANLTVAEPDLRIAAICVAHDADLATGNLRHFERIEGLRVYDWLSDVRSR